MKKKKKSDNKKIETFGSREYFRRQMTDKAIIGIIYYIVLVIGLLIMFKAMSL